MPRVCLDETVGFAPVGFSGKKEVSFSFANNLPLSQNFNYFLKHNFNF